MRMITRSKLVEQLRDYQIRSQHKCPALTIFSPKPFLRTWADVSVAVFWAFLFSSLVISSYLTLYYRHYWISFSIMCLAVFVPVRLKITRLESARKKESPLPLSF